MEKHISQSIICFLIWIYILSYFGTTLTVAQSILLERLANSLINIVFRPSIFMKFLWKIAKTFAFKIPQTEKI